MQEVMTMIGQIGWPITSAVLVMWFAYQLIVRNADERKADREAHQKEMEAFVQALNANTTVLESLKERLK